MGHTSSPDGSLEVLLHVFVVLFIGVVSYAKGAEAFCLEFL